MMPLRRILVPTDFSRCSIEILPRAAEFSAAAGSEVLLMHAVPLDPATPSDVPPYADFGLAVLPAQEYHARIEEEVDRRLHALIAEHFSNVRAARILVRRGDAARAIVEAVTEEGVDLIVMATHGWTGWRHFVFGSVAERVLREADCPVLVLKGSERRASEAASAAQSR